MKLLRFFWFLCWFTPYACLCGLFQAVEEWWDNVVDEWYYPTAERERKL